MATNNAINEPTAASGKVLQGQGVGTTSAFSTATYPSTGTGTGTLLRADGTNWVATTSTYPASNAVSTLLYASSANVMSALATANTAVLATNGSGVPSLTAYPQVSGLGVGASAGSTAGITFDGSNFMNAYATGTFTPTAIGLSTAGTTTYSSQNGYYTKIGNIVWITAFIAYSAATGTGSLVLGGLPFTVKNQTLHIPCGSVIIGDSIVFPVGTTAASITGQSNTTTCQVYCYGTAAAGAYLNIANAAQSIAYSLVYQV